MKLMGTETVYEAYDMDKLLKTACMIWSRKKAIVNLCRGWYNI